MTIEWASASEPAQAERAAGAAAELLAAGGVVVHPTETVYGLGGDGSAGSNALIARVKRRGPERGLILLVWSAAAARKFLPQLRWTPEAEVLAAEYWPGPLSLVVPCADAPAGLAGEGGGVALRATPDPVARAILRAWGRPFTSTSANLTGDPPARTAAEAARCFHDRPDLEEAGDLRILVVDGGPRTEAPPSTVVSFLGPVPRVLREGPISRAEIEGVLAGAGRGRA